MQVSEMMSAGMTADDWFGWVGQIAMLGWFILVFLPRRIRLLFYLPQYLIPFGLGLLYSGLALTNYFTTDGGYDSIESVRALFSNDFMLLAGWVHYLAFDLFIGSWIAKRSDEIGISRLLQAPILVATFMFGPVGLILFLTIQTTLVNQQEVRRD